VLDVFDDLIASRVTGRDVCIRHARDRQVPEALAATVARRGPAVLARPREVVEEEAELALVDHASRLAWRALVVDRVGAPLARHRAVVVGREERARQSLAEAPGVDRGLLLHGVGLEPVSGRLVEEHAAEAVADDHRHAAGRRGPSRPAS
jgi:hypothetical protein